MFPSLLLLFYKLYHSYCDADNFKTNVAFSDKTDYLQNVFLKIFFREGKGGRKRGKRNINVWLPLEHPILGTWSATQACALTGNRTSSPLVHRLALNPLIYQPRPKCNFL